MATPLQRSNRLWLETRPTKVSTGQRLHTDIYAMPANIEIWQADDDQQAADLVRWVNVVILWVLGQ